MGPRSSVPFWRNERVLQIAAQALFVLAVALVAGFLYSNLVHALHRKGLSSGFGFLSLEAGFRIGETPIPYDPGDSYARAFLVGVLNTLRVTAVGIVLATVLGLIAGVARLSPNWLIRQIAAAYVELIRNTPLLVQLVFWYYAVIFKMPRIQESVSFGRLVLISQRGVALPRVHLTSVTYPWLGVLGLATLLAWAVWRVRRQYQESTGRAGYAWLAAIGVWVFSAAIGWGILGPPLRWAEPKVVGLAYEAGAVLTPEFTALLVGLVVYTGAFIAEVVRGGILSVRKGQIEAARALGLREGQILRLIILPQALRVIIPPLTSQYLNLAKNSSLAIAVGFPDLFSIGKTIFNQTGQPVPAVALVMSSYLAMSLFTSLLMNLYNRRVRFLEK
ncbi:MAG: ABC transporter permease subunit [Thermoflexales bacterium]|nr:ABC transporter permease subunit [Thermoflexales bacterium]